MNRDDVVSVFEIAWLRNVSDVDEDGLIVFCQDDDVGERAWTR
jgi:hypothetical protein